jgi:hypothetical protein
MNTSANGQQGAQSNDTVITHSRIDRSKRAESLETGRNGQKTVPEKVHIVFLATGPPQYLEAAASQAEIILARRSGVYDLVFHMITDGTNEMAPEKKGRIEHDGTRVEVHSIDNLSAQDKQMLNRLQDLVTSRGKIYMIKLLLHRVLGGVERAIVLDTDTFLTRDILALWREFDHFENHVVGLVREFQPVNNYWGIAGGGFNGGVQLLDLRAMRERPDFGDVMSQVEAGTFKLERVRAVNLGDQDFWSDLAARTPDFVYALPCEWNYQLCTWWFKPGAGLEILENTEGKWTACYCETQMPAGLVHGNCEPYKTGVIDAAKMVLNNAAAADSMLFKEIAAYQEEKEYFWDHESSAASNVCN